MVHLSLALLGPLEVTLDGQLVTTFESTRVRALLAYLAVESSAGTPGVRTHPREALAELLWPGGAAGSAQTNLRHALSSLRRTLGDATATPPFLLVTRDALAFDPQSDHELDIVAFGRLTRAPDDVAALEQAVALYRGPFLEGALLTDSAAYEAWTLAWREHYARALGAALERLGEHYLERGEPAHAEGHARRLLSLEPLSEAAHRQLMRILAASGRRNEALAQYGRCREVLAEELSVEPDPETTRLYDDLRAGTTSSGQRFVPTALPSVSELAVPSPAPPPTAPNQVADPSAVVLPRLHQLPPAPADFRGREAELQELGDAVLRAGAGLCAIRGLGGMGKTSLALRLAERLCEHYPDAQIYLDLRGTEHQPITPAEAMAHVIHAFHPLAQLPEGEAELGALYQSVLQGRRALLLLDNARDRTQVEPLRPPATCLTLVTTRQRFALPGLHALDLGVPQVGAATTWLRSMAPRLQAAEAEALAQICGYLPLALRVAGSALAEWEDLAPEDYLVALRARQSGLATTLGPVESSLAHSAALLDEALCGRWYALGVFPGTFERAAAEAVWGAGTAKGPTPPQPGGLSELVRYSLVEYDPQARRYRLHDLCRAYTLGRLDAEAAQTARLRHATHYAGVLDKARTLYFASGESIAQGAALYDREAANIEGAFAWLATEAERDDQAARLCLEYLNPPAHERLMGSFRLSPRQRILWGEAGLRAARRLGDREMEIDSWLALGHAYQDTGTEPVRFTQCAEEALTIAREAGNRRRECFALWSLGMARSRTGDHRRALSCLESGLAITRAHEHGRYDGLFVMALSGCYLLIGRAHEALEYARQAVALLPSSPGPHDKAYAYWQMGRGLAAVGEPQLGIPYLEEAEAVFRGAGPPHDLAMSLSFLGEACCAAGDLPRAIASHEEALALCRRIGRRDQESYAQWSLGRDYAAQRDPRRALTCYMQALSLARDVAFGSVEGATLWGMALALDEVGERAQAIACAEQALGILEQMGHTDAPKVRQQIDVWRGAGVT